MRFTQAQERMGQISPPIQPKIKTCVRNYQRAVLKWNPVSIKGYGLFYQFTTDRNLSNIDLIPDGCINVLFQCDERNPQGLLLGIITKQSRLQLQPDTTYFGFKPYSPAAIRPKYLHWAELVDQKIDLKHYFPQIELLTEKILSASNFNLRLQVLLNYAQKHLIDYQYTCSLEEWLAVSMCVSKGQKKVSELVKAVGYTDRHCRERFKQLLGITLAHYNGMMRFQNAVKSFYHNDSISMTRVAHDNGYFDQAHFIRDFKRFVSDSPTQFKSSLSAAK
ncbi:MAG: AraC family transcriptional regulator [Firmicutes bacterium]|nr:AraC family transcriptional regulator [Bacillota bacterium]